MNRRIVLSAVSIVGALAVMGGATFAAFTDSATATNNTFATGNPSLLLSADPGGSEPSFLDTIAGPSFSGLVPGDTKIFPFWIKNASDGDVNFDVTGDVASIVEDADLDDALLVSWKCDQSGDNSLADETPTSEFSPRAWLAGGNTSVLMNLAPGVKRYCEMTGRLPSTAGNEVAGETLHFNVIYDASQVLSTPAPSASPSPSPTVPPV